MLPNLQTWLKGYRRESGPVVSLTENGWHQRLESLSDASGISLPPNVMRHSFGSYFLAFSGNENLTANEMENTPVIVHRNYKELVTKQDAEQYFNITPEKPLGSSGSKLKVLTRAGSNYEDELSKRLTVASH